MLTGLKRLSVRECTKNVRLKLQLGGNHYEQGRQSKTVIPSLIGVLIALLFLLAVVKPTGASEDSTRPMTGTVYFVSGRSVSIVSPDKRTWSYKGKGFSVGDTVSCVVSNNGTSKTVDDYIKSAVVSEGQPIEIEAAEEGALAHFASETYYLERRY